MSGRELSVVDAFHFELFQECSRQKTVDLKVSLNGADRMVNADVLFSSDGHFFLIEFKSSQADLCHEDRKYSACLLCEVLIDSPDMLSLHQQCHFAMWGRKKPRGGLTISCGIYEDLVCRASTIPSCEVVKANSLKSQPVISSGQDLARRVTVKSAGLDIDGFLKYLDWLLGAKRAVNSKDASREFPIALFGTSFIGGVMSCEFRDFRQLEVWAEPFMQKYRQKTNTAMSNATLTDSVSHKTKKTGKHSPLSGKNRRS